jgi:predicted site-specific integrase-resolvase
MPVGKGGVQMDEILLTVVAAAERVGIGATRMRLLCDTGAVRCIVDSAGRRLIREKDLSDFIARGQTRAFAADARKRVAVHAGV